MSMTIDKYDEKSGEFAATITGSVADHLNEIAGSQAEPGRTQTERIADVCQQLVNDYRSNGWKDTAKLQEEKAAVQEEYTKKIAEIDAKIADADVTPIKEKAK